METEKLTAKAVRVIINTVDFARLIIAMIFYVCALPILLIGKGLVAVAEAAVSVANDCILNMND